MSRYRRAQVPGATNFFTVNLLNRRSDLLVRHIELLRETERATRSRHPFHIDARVVLPDHILKFIANRRKVSPTRSRG